MRYYNENPQVTYWKEKFQMTVKEFDDMVNEFNKNVNDYNELENKILSFNALPWYKKMFYKFNI